MGQGLYHLLGFGVVDAGNVDLPERVYNLVRTTYECDQGYIVIPMAVDNDVLQASWNLPALPDGLPRVKPRTAISVRHCEWWPDVGKDGVWVDGRIISMWEEIRHIAGQYAIDLPEGEPVFLSDWH